MNNQLSFHRICSSLGIFLLGYQTICLDFGDLSWAKNQTAYGFILLGIALIGLGMFLQRKEIMK